MAGPIRLEIAHRFDRLPVDGNAWNELVRRAPGSTVFQTHEWFASWHEVFGAASDPWIILAFRGGRLVGIVPLTRDGRTLRFIAEHHADYCDVIAAEDKALVIDAALRYLQTRTADWDDIKLYNIPEGSQTPSLLRTHAAQHGWYSLVRGRIACPTVVFGDVPGGPMELLRKDSLKRPYRYFDRQGSLTFRHVTDMHEVLALLPRFFEQHIDRWRDVRRRSLFSEPANTEFYRALVKHVLPRGWLVFSVVEHDGAPVAFHLGFNYGDTFLWYKPSFDIRLRKHSPGNVMLRFLLEYAIRQNKKEFDFTVGNEPFKRRYSNAVRYNTNILITSRLSAYAAAKAVLLAKRAIRYLLGRPDSL